MTSERRRSSSRSSRAGRGEPKPYLLDVNVLVALAWPNHVHHQRATSWFRSLAGTWATTPVTESALVRLSLTPAVAPSRPSAPEVLAILAAFRAHPRHVFLIDDSSLADAAIDLGGAATAGQVTDLHLVNLVAKHGAVLATLDRRLSGALSKIDQRHVTVLP